jgi:hypothetical protein
VAILLFALLVLVAAAIAQQFRATRFKSQIEARRGILAAAQVSASPRQDGIPEVIRAFAARNGATVGGTPVVFAVQRAEMRLAPGKPFFALRATQLSGTRVPGFVWEATATMAAVVPIRAVDSYSGGAGWLEVRVAGAVPVARSTGPENDKGEMMRFLAELAWNPDAIINASALRWRQIDERTIEVSMETPGGTATVRQLLDDHGDIVGIEADDRPYLVGGKTVPMRWIGRFRNYTHLGAYRLPAYGEIAWVLPAGEFVYWRGQVIEFGRGEPGGTSSLRAVDLTRMAAPRDAA